MGDEELKKKKKIRGGHKGYVTITLEKVQALLDDFELSVANQVKTYRIALTEKLNILSALDEEILTLITEEYIEDEIRETGIFRESIHEMIVRIDETLNAVEVENSGHTDKSISHYPSNSNSFTEGLGAGRAKLPKITLKKFYGDPISFTPFWDSFKSAVDDNPSLSDIDKFNYLRSLLEGSAAGAIRGLPLTAENYGAARDILKKRFGQPQIIINAHMEALVKVAAVTVDNDLKRLRLLYDRVEAHVRALQALGIQCESYGKLLVPLLMEKLPPNMRLIISRAIDQPEWDLDVLLKAFDSEIEARERCESIGTNPSDSFTPKRPFSSQANKGKDVPTGATLTNQSEHPISCTFCKQSHPSASCGTVTDIGARRNLLKQQGRCFVCLRRNHLARNCSLNKACRICSGNHHMSICENANRGNGTSEIQSRGSSVVVSDRRERRSNENKSSTTVYVDSNTSILLQTAIAPVSVVHQWHPVVNMRILFDSGSQRSYLSERARAKLNLLPKRKEKLLIKTFGQENEQLRECDVVEFCVRGLSEGSKVQMTALAVPLICSPLKDQAVQFAQQCYSHLADLELADHPSEDCGSEVDLLIGNDFYWSFFIGDVKRGKSGPVAMKTILGWVLSGPIPHAPGSGSDVNLVTCHTLRLNASSCDDLNVSRKDEDPLLEQVKKFWEIESIGVSPHEGTVHDKFLDTIRACDGRYEVSLPWKEQHALLPDNYALAVSRLASVLKRLRGNPKLFAEYNRIIEEQSLQGIISDVDPHAPVQVGRLHYLPHHPVVREDKQTTKVRIVYDASAKSTGPSLNDCLHAGPSLISDIPDVLMRFRYHQIALAADIEKAFLMVQVAKADRDVLRFLWINDPTSEDPNIVVKRFNRVVFGVTSSPFLLNGTVRHHVSNYEVEDPQFVNDFLSSLYVDDFNGGKDSVPEAFQLYSKAKSRMKEGGFFERMVRCVKRCLKKILKSAKLTYEELLTVVVEIECVLNSRPLTYVSSEDRVEPLTPSHLLTERRLLSIPDEPIVAEEKSSDVEILTRRQRYVTSLLSHFWNRWKQEYVVELREHHRALEKGAASNSPSIQTGDIVTVMEEGKSNRGMWRLGKVLDVHPGNDGLVRGATIEVASDNGKRRRLRRPLQKLFPLEVRETRVADVEEHARPIACTPQRQRRQAAIEGEMRRRQVDQCLEELKDYDEH